MGRVCLRSAQDLFRGGQPRKQRRGVRRDHDLLPLTITDAGFSSDPTRAMMLTGMQKKSCERATMVVAAEMAKRSTQLSQPTRSSIRSCTLTQWCAVIVCISLRSVATRIVLIQLSFAAATRITRSQYEMDRRSFVCLCHRICDHL